MGAGRVWHRRSQSRGLPARASSGFGEGRDRGGRACLRGPARSTCSSASVCAPRRKTVRYVIAKWAISLDGRGSGDDGRRCGRSPASKAMLRTHAFAGARVDAGPRRCRGPSCRTTRICVCRLVDGPPAGRGAAANASSWTRGSGHRRSVAWSAAPTSPPVLVIAAEGRRRDPDRGPRGGQGVSAAMVPRWARRGSNFRPALAVLASRGVERLLVEGGGARVHGAFVREGPGGSRAGLRGAAHPRRRADRARGHRLWHRRHDGLPWPSKRSRGASSGMT